MCRLPAAKSAVVVGGKTGRRRAAGQRVTRVSRFSPDVYATVHPEVAGATAKNALQRDENRTGKRDHRSRRWATAVCFMGGIWDLVSTVQARVRCHTACRR